jgi:hypothetical protein
MRTHGKGNIYRYSESGAFRENYSARYICDWRLVTRDDAPTVETPGYFDPLASAIDVGEAILVTLDMDGTPQLRMYVVTAKSSLWVKVSPLTIG